MQRTFALLLILGPNPAVTGQGEKTPDIYAIIEALRKAPGIAWAEPDYLRKPVGTLER